MEDNDLLCEAGDEIDNAVHQALVALSYEPLDWDMSLIGAATDALESVLERFGKHCCRPFENADESICYNSEERCAYCKGKKKYNK